MEHWSMKSFVRPDPAEWSESFNFMSVLVDIEGLHTHRLDPPYLEDRRYVLNKLGIEEFSRILRRKPK